jgi:hypothetical protein
MPPELHDHLDFKVTADRPEVAWYHGTSGHDVALEDADGHLLGPLPHVSYHSPTGFGWGYADA